MNTAKMFLNLTPKECLEIYPEVEKNAAELYRAAKVLGDQGMHGKAILSISSLHVRIDGYSILVNRSGI